MCHAHFEKFLLSFRRYAYTDKFDNELWDVVNEELNMHEKTKESGFMNWV